MGGGGKVPAATTGQAVPPAPATMGTPPREPAADSEVSAAPASDANLSPAKMNRFSVSPVVPAANGEAGKNDQRPGNLKLGEGKNTLEFL